MNVLIVHPCKGFYGGAEEVVGQLYSYLESRGDNVTIVTKNAPLGDYTQGKRLYNATSWRDFYRAVRSRGKGVNAIVCFNFPATLATLGLRKKTVWYCNEPPELFTSALRKPLEAFNRWWVRRANMRCVVATPFDADRFERIYHVEPDIVPYGINYDFWSTGKHEARRPDRLRLLQVGTISPYKNQESSIKVLRELLDANIDASLTLVGKYNEPYFKTLYFLIKELQLEYKVTFMGQRTQEEVRRLYQTHDILLHPVRSQGGWLAPFEALCTGLPVIATTDFPAKAYLYKIGMPVALPEGVTTVVKTVWQHYENFEKQSQDTAGYVRDNLSWDLFGERMMNIFQEVLDE